MHTPFLPHAELPRRPSVLALRETNIPIDHAVSLGLPTRRWLGAGQAYFASPTLRLPGAPIEQSPPDRWWVLDAHTGRLIVYALVKAISFSENLTEWASVTLPPVSRSVSEQADRHRRVGEFLDRLGPTFFGGEPGDASWRRAFDQELAELIPAPLLPQYEALVPDFFTWLRA